MASLLAPPTPVLLPTPTLAPTLVPPPVAPAPEQPAAEVPVVGDQTGGDQTAASGFNGTFVGALTTDGGSSAPATLTLAQDGSIVGGTINVGQGLVVNGGNCGQTPVPAGNVNANGQIDPANPNRLAAESMFNVQGLMIKLQLVGELSADGQTLNAQAGIDLPMLCGRDPVISGTFTRQ